MRVATRLMEEAENLKLKNKFGKMRQEKIWHGLQKRILHLANKDSNTNS